MASAVGIAVDNVHITLRRSNGVVALDTVITVAPGDTLSLALPVSVSTLDEQFTVRIELRQGTTVLYSGEHVVTAVLDGAGAPPPPIVIEVDYTGPGATATQIRITPRDSVFLTTDHPVFAIVGTDASGTVLPDVPVVWTTSDESLATVDAVTGELTPANSRGIVTLRATALNGITDTLPITLRSPLATIAVIEGANQSGAAGHVLPLAFAVEVLAADGLPAAGETVQFTAPEHASVATSTMVTGTDGRASTTLTLAPSVGAQVFTAAVGSLEPVTVTQTAVPGGPATLAAQATGTLEGIAGQALPAPLGVLVTDDVGLPVPDATVSWTASGGTLGAATSNTGADGIATVTYAFGPGVGTFIIDASVAALSASFTATASAALPAQLAVASGDAQRAPPATSLSPFVVRLADQFDNPVGGATVTWTRSAGSGTVSAVASTTDSAGRASIAYTTGPSAGHDTVVAAVGDLTATFAATTEAAAPSQLMKIAGDSQTVVAGTLVPQLLEARVTDATGNGTAATVDITVSGPGITTPLQVQLATDSAGYVTVPSDLLERPRIAGTYTAAMQLSGSASAPVVFTLVVVPAPASALILTAAPTTATSGVSLAEHPVVQLVDSIGNPVALAGVVVTASADATLGGTTTETTSATGSAVFTDLSITSAASSVTLTFSAPSLTPVATSITLSAGAPSAATSTIAAATTSLLVGATTQLTVMVKDAGGFPVGNAIPDDVDVVASAGTIGEPSCSDGTCTASYTAAATAGEATITATIDGLHIVGSPLTVTAFASGASVEDVTVAPAADTLTSIGDGLQLTATATDSSGSPIPGTFAWVSRDPAVVTVDSAGQVAAVSNGATYVVAAETGGVADSARITVQQRVVTVQVLPGSLSLYLGATRQLTAAAVDGRGQPVGSPSFTWTSTATGIVGVDGTGLLSGLALGGSQVHATVDGITGVASVNVITPITRIAVGVDSAGVPVANGTPLAAFNQSRQFIAVAYDTLDAPMNDVAFTWASTNASVAQLESVDGATASGRAAANGTTTITASAQGVTGASALSVQQVLSAIQLTPVGATIAPSGTVGLIARGVDANGFFISGGGFAYTSSDPSKATVGATSGVVTGVALGSTSVTATSGTIVSNAATVTVSSSVPPVISFGRDTLSVGRGSTTSIPIFLSTPHASPVTVSLGVEYPYAHFASSSVVIDSGQTAVNVTLVGDSAGTTRVFASDASDTGFAPDTAALAVQATLRLAHSSFNMNATDSRATQVLLSDPSPPGGTYVVLTFGAGSIAAASPNPAFIPQGQLAADVIINGTSTATSTASTTVIPSAIGVNGTASNVTVYPSTITMSRTSLRMGAGQFRDDTYAYVQTNNNASVPLAFASSDTTVATVTSSAAIPGGSYYSYFMITARAPGAATITVSSPGWTAPNSIAVTVTTPHVSICCGATFNTTSPARSITVYSADSLEAVHSRTSSLVVRLSSSDTTVVRLVDSTVTIGAGQYYNNAGRVIPGGMGGSAWIRAHAGGHITDSVQFTVTGPKLQWSSVTQRIGVGQMRSDPYVYTPDNVTSPLEVTILNSDSSIVAMPSTMTILAGTNYQYALAQARAVGAVSVIATAPGYSPDTMTFVATTPMVVLSGGGTISNFAPPRSITVYSTDSAGSAHPRIDSLEVRLSSTDTTVITVDSIARIAGGSYYTNLPRATTVGVGTALVIATATGHTPDTLTYTVTTPQIQFNRAAYTIGAAQHRQPSEFYVHTPDNRTTDLLVSFTHTDSAVAGIDSASVTIPTGTYYRYFQLRGLTLGIDTIVVSATGYRPDTLVIRVTSTKLTGSSLPGGRTTTSPAFGVTINAADSLGTAHFASDTVVIQVTSSDTTVIRPSVALVRILPNNYYVQPTIDIVGPGTATLTYTDTTARYAPFTTNAMTVTGPSLAMSSSTVKLGMGQTTGSNGAYVQVPNAVASPLVVSLVSTDVRVATVPATVTIPAGSYYAYFPIEAQDTIGTVLVQASATGYSPAATSVQVTIPRFQLNMSTSAYTTSPSRTITIYATDADGNARNVRSDLTVTLASSAPGVAAIDSTTVTIPAGQYYSNAARWSPVATGTAQITVSDARAVYQKYTSATVNVTVETPPLFLNSIPQVLGIGQYADFAYASSAEAQSANLTIALSHAGTARTSVPGTLTIAAGAYYTYFRITGTEAGTDTLIASASSPMHFPDSAVTVVSAGRIDPIGGWPTSLAVGDSVQLSLYARDPGQTNRKVAQQVTWALSPSAGIEFRSGGGAITSVTIPADGDRVVFYLKAVEEGSATASITSANYTTYTNNVTVTP